MENVIDLEIRFERLRPDESARRKTDVRSTTETWRLISSAPFPKTLDPRFRGDDAAVSNRCDAARLALGRLRNRTRPQFRRSRGGGNPFFSEPTWIPAFAGMTRPSPIAATLRVLLLDVCVTWREPIFRFRCGR